jgi:lysyl-tRNA synthetase class II
MVLAGRLMSVRVMGKASFAVLRDSTGDQQIYVNRDEIAQARTRRCTTRSSRSCCTSATSSA